MFLINKIKKFVIILFSISLVLLLLLLIFLAVARPTHANNASTSSSSTISSSSSASSSDVVAVTKIQPINPDAGYDKNIYPVDVFAYSDVILGSSNNFDPNYIAETLFIGDSNTEGLALYGHLPIQNVLGLNSMGIQSVPSKQFIYFADDPMPYSIVEAVARLQPRRIVINFGTNNAAGNSSDSFIEAYEQAIDLILKKSPHTDIIIASILPVSSDRSNTKIKMKNIDEFNTALLQFCRDEGYSYLNTAESFKDPKTGFADEDLFGSDGIHLTSEGYVELMDYVESHPLITSDSHPVLGVIPSIVPAPTPVVAE